MRKRATRAVQIAEHWRAHSHLQKVAFEKKVAIREDKEDKESVQPVGLVKKDIVDRPKYKSDEDE